MKKLLYFFTFAFSLLIVFSCEPARDQNGDLLFGVDGAGGTGGGGTPPSGRLLTKMESHAIDLETGEMSDETLTFQYEGTKLVSTTDQDGNVTLITYNSNNRISKLTSAGQTATLEYSGSNVSKLTSDITGLLKTTSTFTYSGSKLTKVATIHEFTFPIPMKSYIEGNYTYSGSNIVKTIIKTGIYNFDGQLEMSPDDQVYDISFDDKKSPYKLLPSEYLSYMFGMGPHGAFLQSANNHLQLKISATGTPAETTNYTHIYDSEGYPTKTTSSADEYIIYTYK